MSEWASRSCSSHQCRGPSRLIQSPSLRRRARCEEPSCRREGIWSASRKRRWWQGLQEVESSHPFRCRLRLFAYVIIRDTDGPSWLCSSAKLCFSPQIHFCRYQTLTTHPCKDTHDGSGSYKACRRSINGRRKYQNAVFWDMVSRRRPARTK